MRHRILIVASLSVLIFAPACQHRSPVGPTESGTLDQLVNGLRQQGLSVSPAGAIPPEINRIFSVPAQQLLVNAPPVDPFEARVNVFEYASVEAASAEAARVSADGQPRPDARVTWVSTPRFYRQTQLIVLYVGCSADIVRALQATIGPPFVTGGTPCRLTN